MGNKNRLMTQKEVRKNFKHYFGISKSFMDERDSKEAGHYIFHMYSFYKWLETQGLHTKKEENYSDFITNKWGTEALAFLDILIKNYTHWWPNETKDK